MQEKRTRYRDAHAHHMPNITCSTSTTLGGLVLSTAHRYTGLPVTQCPDNTGMCSRCTLWAQHTRICPHYTPHMHHCCILLSYITLLYSIIIYHMNITQVVSPANIYFNPVFIWRKHEYWRLFTNFFYFGQLGMSVCMYLCVYVSVCVCICVCMYLCVYVFVCVCIYVSMYLCVYVFVCVCICVCGTCVCCRCALVAVLHHPPTLHCMQDST